MCQVERDILIIGKIEVIWKKKIHICMNDLVVLAFQ